MNINSDFISKVSNEFKAIDESRIMTRRGERIHDYLVVNSNDMSIGSTRRKSEGSSMATISQFLQEVMRDNSASLQDRSKELKQLNSSFSKMSDLYCQKHEGLFAKIKRIFFPSQRELYRTTSQSIEKTRSALTQAISQLPGASGGDASSSVPTSNTSSVPTSTHTFRMDESDDLSEDEKLELQQKNLQPHSIRFEDIEDVRKLLDGKEEGTWLLRAKKNDSISICVVEHGKVLQYEPEAEYGLTLEELKQTRRLVLKTFIGPQQQSSD